MKKNKPTQSSIFKRIFCLCLALTSLGALGCEAEVLDGEEIAEAEGALYANSYSIWPTLTIPVCWENPLAKDAQKREWVKESVTDTWQAYSKVAFTGWGPCTAAKTGGVRIKVDNYDYSKTIDLGRFLKDQSGGISLNFEFHAPKDYRNCVTQSVVEECIRHLAVHEFGHALGFAHEQNRPDAILNPKDPVCKVQGPGANVRSGDYDRLSVMNYCASDKLADYLSPNDIFGLQSFYGNPDASLFRKDAIRVDSSTAYFFFGNRYTRYDMKKNVMADLGTSTTYPRPTSGAWVGWPSSFSTGVDSILKAGNSLFMTNNRNYLVYDLAKDKVVAAPRTLTGRFAGIPTTWTKIDAAIQWSSSRYYLFRGKDYVRYDITAGCTGGIDICGKVPSGYPKPIAGNWPGLSWSNLDQVIECGTNEICFFRGSDFIRYRKSGPEGALSGYPARIVGQFPGVTF